MSSILFFCPFCGAKTEIDGIYLGHSGPCYCCGRTIKVPKRLNKGNTLVGARRGQLGNRAFWMVTILCGIGFVVACSLGLIFFVVRPASMAPGGASPQTICQSNLQQLAEAMNSYHDVNGGYPPAYIEDEYGKPIHSWRVLILPELGYDWLFEEYDMSQPWDSDHNLQLADQMPPVFACPAQTNAQAFGETSYVVVVGKETMFPGSKRTKRKDITDGPGNTLMIVEVNSSQVTWTEPRDLDLASMESLVRGLPSNSVGSLHGDGSYYVTADEKAHVFDQITSREQLRALLTIQGADATEPSQ